MEKEQSILDTIYILYDSFFEQEKKIANYILHHTKEVVNMTISELAEASGTSVATISRFCRKCNADGFHHLKISLAKDAANSATKVQVSNTISRKDIGQSLQNILANKIEELTQTFSLINERELEKILQAIEHAGVVQLVAVGNTIPVAIDGAFKLNEMGISAVAGEIWETQLGFTLSLKPTDVLIAISNSGESKRVVKMVREAKKNKVTTVAITNNLNSTLGREVKYSIQTATREKLFMDEFCFSRVSATTVMEIIYLLLATGREERYASMTRLESLIADEKF
ncbi:Sialic acid utilization regulator, RpiR family [Lachnospiraceae bacterium TWA4]|nr:Sialic acid utilization regulator, RpiR family [Lachnospiraceae bacterium TWA4]